MLTVHLGANSAWMSVRPLLPNQSGIQAGWARSHWLALLLIGELPMLTKKLDPGSGLPFSVMPHCAREAWMASKARVFVESFG